MGLPILTQTDLHDISDRFVEGLRGQVLVGGGLERAGSSGRAMNKDFYHASSRIQ